MVSAISHATRKKMVFLIKNFCSDFPPSLRFNAFGWTISSHLYCLSVLFIWLWLPNHLVAYVAMLPYNKLNKASEMEFSVQKRQITADNFPRCNSSTRMVCEFLRTNWFELLRNCVNTKYNIFFVPVVGLKRWHITKIIFRRCGWIYFLARQLTQYTCSYAIFTYLLRFTNVCTLCTDIRTASVCDSSMLVVHTKRPFSEIYISVLYTSSVLYTLI